jgi:hypothetical protein
VLDVRIPVVIWHKLRSHSIQVSMRYSDLLRFDSVCKSKPIESGFHVLVLGATLVTIDFETLLLALRIYKESIDAIVAPVQKSEPEPEIKSTLEGEIEGET